MVAASLLVARSWVTCGPASIAQVTSLRIAATASEAWVVEMEPVPDSIALIIAQISLPRTSPTIWRERLKRNESTSASSRVNSPAMRPSGPRSPEPGRASHGWTIRCRSRSSCRCSSYSVSKVPIASSGSISAHSARTRVVLPAPCDPETTMDLRARTAARRNDAATGVSICRVTRSSRVTSISR